MVAVSERLDEDRHDSGSSGWDGPGGHSTPEQVERCSSREDFSSLYEWSQVSKAQIGKVRQGQRTTHGILRIVQCEVCARDYCAQVGMRGEL